MNIEIRAARHDDIDDLAEAHVAGWRVGYRGLFPDEYLDSAEFEEERRSSWRSRDWREAPPNVFVGVLDGRPVAFGIVGPEIGDNGEELAHPSGRGQLYAFYQHPDGWGSGVAMQLIQRCEQYLRDEGYAEAVLWVLRDNPRARRFYEKAGWTSTGIENLWTGPSTSGLPEPDQIADVQYHRTL